MGSRASEPSSTGTATSNAVCEAAEMKRFAKPRREGADQSPGREADGERDRTEG